MDNFDLRKYLAEGRLFEEEVDVLGNEFLQDIQDTMKMYYKMDVDMDDIKDWVNMYYIDYNSEYDDEEDKKELVFDTAEREDFYMHLNPDAESTFPSLAEGKLMDNFDLKKYLAEGRLLKENIDMATILSHDDYKELYIGNRAEHDASPEEEQFSDEYIIDLKPGMYQMIYWNDEGPDYTNFDSKEEYIKDTIAGYWDIEHFERKFGLTDELDAAGDNWESVFHKHIEDNLDMYYEELNKLINDSEADGDSANGVVLLQNGKVVAGEATDIRTRFD